MLSNWGCSGLFPGVIYGVETAASINGGKISNGGHEGPHGLSAGCSLLRVLETVMISRLQFGFNHGVHRELSVLFSTQQRRSGADLLVFGGALDWASGSKPHTRFHHPLPLLFYLFLSLPPFSLTACLNETLLWLCGLWSLTVRLKTLEYVCAQRYTPKRSGGPGVQLLLLPVMGGRSGAHTPRIKW